MMRVNNERYYIMLKDNWKTYLEPIGVKLPKENTWQRKTLEFLYENINEWVTKKAIMEGIGYTGTDLQAPRHLSAFGWYIKQDLKGKYKFVTTEKVYPKWIPDKRTTNIVAGDWDEIKKFYNYKCATCGSKEGELHNHINKITKIEKGHKDPELDLTIENTIPQCKYCNGRFKDNFKFDNYGLPVMFKIENVWTPVPNYNRKK